MAACLASACERSGSDQGGTSTSGSSATPTQVGPSSTGATGIPDTTDRPGSNAQTTGSSTQPTGGNSSSSSGASASEGSSPGDTGTGTAPLDPRIRHETQGSNTQTTVDSTSKTEWVFLDLDASLAWSAPYSSQLTNPDWDIAMQRFKFKLNGGANGSADVSGLWVDGAAAFEDMSAVPPGEFKSDAPASGTNPGQEGLLFGDWYDYNRQTHQLTPKARAYVVKSSRGAYFKIKILGYYGADGAAGHLKFLWSKLPQPPRAGDLDPSHTVSQERG